MTHVQMRRLSRPPVFPDEEQTQVARMFSRIAIATGLIVTSILPVIIVVQPDAFWRALFAIGVVDGLVLVTLLP